MISVSADALALNDKVPSPAARANSPPEIELQHLTQLFMASDYCPADTPLLDNPPSDDPTDTAWFPRR